MALLKTLLNRFLPKSSTREQKAADRYAQLETLQRKHSFIEVKFPRLEQSFQSMIMELHPDEGYLVIDELYPAEGRQNLLEGDLAEISGKNVGIAVSFFSKLLAREATNGTPVYRMELPEEIGASFRRNSYRVYVEREPGLIIDIRGEDGTPFDTRIVNLSADGIKISLRGDVTQFLEKHRTLDDCLIRLPLGVDIDCSIDIRNAYLMRTPSLYTLSGGKLTINTPSHRTKLDQYLAAVQRKQRRREARLS